MGKNIQFFIVLVIGINFMVLSSFQASAVEDTRACEAEFDPMYQPNEYNACVEASNGRADSEPAAPSTRTATEPSSNDDEKCDCKRSAFTCDTNEQLQCLRDLKTECAAGKRPKSECPGAADDNGSNESLGASSCPDLNLKAQACSQAVTAASGSCDSDKNGELNSVNSAASQISSQLGGITSSNIAMACSNFAKVSQTANAAFASYQAYCLSEKLTAQNACNEFDAVIKENQSNPLCADSIELAQSDLANSKAILKTLQTRVNQAQTAMNQLAQTSMNAEQCKCMTSASQSDPSCASKFDPCAKDPNSQLCLMSKMTECNLPQNASTPLCICNKNPSDPICPGSFKPNTTGQGVTNNSSGGSSSSSSGGSQTMFDNRLKGTAAGGPDLNMDRPGFVAPEGGQKADSMSVGGGGSNSLLSGSGVNAAGGRKGSGGFAGEKDPIRVTAGFRGGGGGAGGPGGSSSGAGGYGIGGAGRGALGEKVDLRQFLPNGKYDPRIRGIAGLRQNPDGITGPHSDIWMKIKARYLYQTPSLNP